MLKPKKPLTIYKNTFLLALILSIFGNGWAQEVILSDYEKKIKNGFSLRNAVDKISPKDIEKSLRDFVGKTRPNRVSGSAGALKAHAHIWDFLNAHKGENVSVVKQEFTINEGTNNLQGANFVWTKKGEDQTKNRLILMAHFDTILKEKDKVIKTGEMPGADNNASSISVLFSLISLLNQLNLPKTVEIVFLDAHEMNFEGAKNYFKNYPINVKDDFIINLSKLGHDSKKADKLSKLNNVSLYLSYESTKLEQDFAQSFIENAARNYPQLSISLKQQTMIFKEDPIDYIWGQKLPGIMFSQDRENDLNPRLYSSNDFAETINFNTLFFVYKALASSVLSLNYGIVK